MNKKLLVIVSVIFILVITISIILLLNNNNISYQVVKSKENIITKNYNINNNNVYYLGIDDVNIKVNNKYSSLEYLLNKNKITLNKILRILKNKKNYNDDIIYYNNDLAILKCHNNNYIIGTNIKYNKSYCNNINSYTGKVIKEEDKLVVKVKDNTLVLDNYDDLENDKVKIYYTDDLEILSISKVEGSYCNIKEQKC